MKKTHIYDAIRKLTSEQRKEILDFARKRSREIMDEDMPKLEKDIEKKFCEYAKTRGCYPIKFEDPARRGAPDRMILCPGGRALFIEFKRPGETPRDEQLEYVRSLRGLGFWAGASSTYGSAVSFLDDFLIAPYAI